MTKDEMFEKAEEVILSWTDVYDPFLGLVENGATQEEADTICNLINAAIVRVDWPDWIGND